MFRNIGKNSRSGGSGGAGNDGNKSPLPQRPDLARQWELEAREQRIRAQISEDAHASDAHQLYAFLQHRGASPNRKHGIVEQMLAYCSNLAMEREDALNEMRVLQRKLVAKDNEAVNHVMQQLSMATRQHELDKKQMEGEHQQALHAQEEKHKEALQRQHADNERVIDEIIDAHDAELEVYSCKVRELASDLISQSDDFRPATDQGLRMKLLDLRNRIKNITVPNNLQGGADPVSAAGIHQLPPDLDPTSFVARHGSRDIQYILRGLVWKALIEAFFSSPFGFGFLGSGQRQLLEIHRAWRRLYDGLDDRLDDDDDDDDGQHPCRSDELSMYSHDPYANKMRSALFQSFLPAVYPGKASKPDTGVAKLYRQHCDSVVVKIRQLLDRITNNNTRPDALEAVPTIVSLAAELGLECGVQRAQIWLLVPRPNETVTLGAEYADCLGASSGGGDGDGGRDVEVDLVVSPGIVRIGDGRQDMTVRKALVPCEVFPMRDGD